MSIVIQNEREGQGEKMIRNANCSKFICEKNSINCNFDKLLIKNESWGAWVARSVERPTSGQVMLSRFIGSRPTSGFVLTAQRLEPASDSMSPSLSAPSLLTHSLSVSQK